MWLQEASIGEMVLAWAEKAYTFRELVHAIHKSGAASMTLHETAN